MDDQHSTAAIRFGFGLPLPAGAPDTPQAMMAALRGPDHAAAAHPGPVLAQILPAMREADRLRRAASQSEADRKAHQQALQVIDELARQGTKASFARALSSPDGFRERLVRFWADHFTAITPARHLRALPLSLVDDAIRPNLTAPFATLLEAAVLHPAMLSALDQVQSIGPNSVAGLRRGAGLNENLARELLELHTLGVGAGYTQTDTRQMAELLTGVTYTAEDGFAFRPRWAEPGAETVLGQRFAGEGLAPVRAALQMLAVHPETARHIAGKLVVHFVADLPDPALVNRLADVWRDTDGDLEQVYAALLDQPAAWAPLGGKARQPFDFMMAALRGLGLGAAEVVRMAHGPLTRLIMRPMAEMGQPWLAPRGPDGWPEEAGAWITPQGLAARISWSMEVPARLVPALPDPQDFARTVLGGVAGERLLWAAARAETIREGVGLVLASPEFNRR